MAKRKTTESNNLPIIRIKPSIPNWDKYGILTVEVLTLNINTNNMRVRLCQESVEKVGGKAVLELPATQFFEQMKIVPVWV
jgi:hypothetical protein